MSKLIQIYRHHESIKDPVRGKIPTPEGIAKSNIDGYNASQQYQGAEVRGYHSSAIRTEMALDAYLEGFGSGSKRSLGLLDEVAAPDEVKKLRKKLGDDGSMKLRLEKYDKEKNQDDLETTVSYYESLHERAKSLVSMIKREIEDAIKNPEKNEIVVCYGHEPSLAVSIIELAKEYLGYDGKSNAEFFKEITGSGQHYFGEGTGYAIEVRKEKGKMKIYLIVNNKEIELREEDSEEEEEGSEEDSEESTEE